MVLITDEFKFEINWNDMPSKVVKALTAAKNANKEGDQSDITALKNAIAVKIVSKYTAYRLANPSVTRKSPGVRVCEYAARQVIKM